MIQKLCYPYPPHAHVTAQKVTNLSYKRHIIKYILVLCDAPHHKRNHKQTEEEIN